MKKWKTRIAYSLFGPHNHKPGSSCVTMFLAAMLIWALFSPSMPTFCFCINPWKPVMKHVQKQKKTWFLLVHWLAKKQQNIYLNSCFLTTQEIWSNITTLTVFPWISWIYDGSTQTSQIHCCINYKNSKSWDTPRHVPVRTYLLTIVFLWYCMLSPFWKICKTPTSISHTKIFTILVGKSFFHPEILSMALAGARFLSFFHYGMCELDNIILVCRF